MIPYKLLRSLLCWIPGKERRRAARAKVCAKILRKKLPKIYSIDETLDLLSQGYSIARFGDGEFGYLACMCDKISDFQGYDPELRKRMQEVLKMGNIGKLLIGIPGFDAVYHTLYYYENYSKLIPYFNFDAEYANSLISRVSEIGEFSLDKFRNIWAGRKVVFMYSSQGRFYIDPRLFDNIAETKYIDVPAHDAFDEYDRIMKDARKVPKDWLFLIAAGPTASVLAADLYNEGYQAIDLGHLPNCLAAYMGEQPAPECLPSKKR